MAVNAKLSRYQEQAVAALLTESTVAGAAEKAGVGARTLERWLSEDTAFREAYRVARRRVLEDAIGRLQGATARAMEALERNLRCGVPATEVRAAQTVFRLSLDGLEMYDLSERMDRIEAALAAHDELKTP